MAAPPGLSTAERDSNNIIEQQLDARLSAVAKAANADVLTYMGPLYPHASDEIKDAVELIDAKQRKLLVVLETVGGYMDVAERAARIFRHHYSEVGFIVPSFAMSAGTILVMSGDDIYMDYASVLGPIDPQIERGDQLVPALGYLVQYERLIDKSAKGTLTTAELTFLVENFDAAELYRYEQERALSIALLEDWLAKYKFKAWVKTKTRGAKVTGQMRKDRATEIAEALNDTDRWHSHSRGIPMEVLRRDLKLLIEDFGADPNLGPALHDYYRLLRDYGMTRRGHYFFILHTEGRYVGY
jgi:Serine dehydrogenase proteinase